MCIHTYMCIYVYMCVYTHTHLRSSCMWYVYIHVCRCAHLCLYVQRPDKDVKCFSLLLSALFCKTGSLNEPEDCRFSA